MNKKITRKLMAAVAVALYFVGGANAQILNDWVEGGYGGSATPGDVVDSVTIGTKQRFIVEPDPYYSPSYVKTTNTNVNANNTWSWFAAYNTSGNDLPAKGSDTTRTGNNIIDVTFGSTVGLDSIGVYENTPLGCGGDTSYLKVYVLAQPAVTFTTPTVAGIFGADTTLCASDAYLDGSNVPQAKFTGIPTFQLDYALEIYTLKADLTPTGTYYKLDKTAFASVDSALAARGYNGNQITNISATTFDLTLPGDSKYTAINNSITVYKYTIMGTNGRISRKSDYLSNSGKALTGWTWYDTTAETITIQVNPAPVTGPIYHISNTWVN